MLRCPVCGAYDWENGDGGCNNCRAYVETNRQRKKRNDADFSTTIAYQKADVTKKADTPPPPPPPDIVGKGSTFGDWVVIDLCLFAIGLSFLAVVAKIVLWWGLS